MARRFAFRKLREVNTPSRSYDDAAGWDFYVPNYWPRFSNIKNPPPEVLTPSWESILIRPGQSICVPSGLQLRMHTGWGINFENRSGNGRKGLLVGAKIGESDYQGEYHLNVWNVSKDDITIRRGDKLIQGIFFEIPRIELHEIEPHEQLFIETSARGANGFGSTDQRQVDKQLGAGRNQKSPNGRSTIPR